MVTTTTRKAASRAKDSEKTKMPVMVFRPGNGVSLAIYEDTLKPEGGKTRTVYSGSIRKSYRNGEGKWAHVQTLYPSDFLNAALAFQEAYKWVLEQYQDQALEFNEPEEP
jgi:hypothetical protein